uniref:BTB domain-containing protein n=1 Tax=Steinernema glaseri TaxID=37863 RepID=A0A1I7YC57_9BILA
MSRSFRFDAMVTLIQAGPNPVRTHTTFYVYGERATDLSTPSKCSVSVVEKEVRWKFRGTDAYIVTSDGSKVGVNRRKLASYSPFFTAAFFAGFEETSTRVVRLPLFSFDRIYECIYLMEKMDLSSDITFHIGLRKALQIFETANYLAIDMVCDWLSMRIVELMVPEELIYAYRRVEYRCPKLAQRLNTLIVQNCDKLYKNKLFMELTEEEMIGLLKKPRLNITPSQEKAMVDQFIEKSTEHDNLTLKAMRSETTKRNDSWGYLGKPRTPNKVLITFGGWSASGPSNAVDVFDTCSNSWKLPDSRLFETPKAYHVTVSSNRSFFTIGGFNGTEYYSTVRRFDFDEMLWKDVAGMTETRCYVSACVFDHDSRILAAGGHNGHIRLNTAEIYDIKKNEWARIDDMLTTRSDAHAVNINGNIAVLGGFDGTNCHRTCEYFDVSTNRWLQYAGQMRAARSGVSAVAVNGAIFATGGFNGSRRLTSTEFFDPREGVWHNARPMRMARSNFALAEMDGRVYVSGGFDGSATTDACEVYDFRSDQWTPLPKLNVRRSAGYSTVVEYHDIIDALTDPRDEFKPSGLQGNRHQFDLVHRGT